MLEIFIYRGINNLNNWLDNYMYIDSRAYFSIATSIISMPRMNGISFWMLIVGVLYF
jgi:hypothetical protein